MTLALWEAQRVVEGLLIYHCNERKKERQFRRRQTFNCGKEVLDSFANYPNQNKRNKQTTKLNKLQRAYAFAVIVGASSADMIIARLDNNHVTILASKQGSRTTVYIAQTARHLDNRL